MSIAALNVTREEARAEVGKILLAQEDLAFFSEYMSMDDDGIGWYVAHKMHQLIAYELQQVLLETLDLARVRAVDPDALDEIGDERFFDKVGKVLGDASPTLQEAFMTAIRVRLADVRARKFLAQTLKSKREGGAAPAAPRGGDPGHR